MGMTYVATGCSRGLGLEFARQLAGRGDRVIAGVRRPDEATALNNLDVEVLRLDVSDGASVASFARALGGTPVDVLINNAGIGVRDRPLEKLDFDEVARFFAVNSIGPLRVTQTLLPNLRARERKLVVNLTSRMGSIDDNSSGGSYGYRASKAALNMLTRNLAIDLDLEGFICVVLHPGWVRTDMGGAHAPLTVAESISGMLRVMDGLSRRDSGRFFDYQGAAVAW